MDIGHALDREWARINRSKEARRALRRWAEQEEALVGLRDLEEVLERRIDARLARPILSALGRLAPQDALAARTLLQALMPGLVRMAGEHAGGDREVLDNLVALAWERISTYPSTRPGSVAANVLWDVRKRYRKGRVLPDNPLEDVGPASEPTVDSAEDVAVRRSIVGEVVEAQRRGVISPGALLLVLRTRVGGELLQEVAAEGGASVHALNQRRWKAEHQLRLALAG